MVRFLAIFLSLLLLSFQAFAQYTVIEGRLLDSLGTTPVEEADVDFYIEVYYDSGETCLMYSESYLNTNMSNSGGYFNFELGGGSTPVDHNGGGVVALFDNTGVSTCQSGSGGPVANAPRYLKISYDANDGNGMQNLAQLIKIASTPYAMYAQYALQVPSSSIGSLEITDGQISDLDLAGAGAGGGGQVLTSDGSGGFTWSSAGAGDMMADGSVPMTGALDMGNMLINNLLDPVALQDAATKNYVDAQVAANGNGDMMADGSVPMTGALDMGNMLINNLLDPVALQDAATKNYVDAQVAANGNGDMMADGSVPMTGALDMGNMLINNLLDPVALQDAATKNYVDAQVAANGNGDMMADGSVPMTGALDMGNMLINNLLDPVALQDAATKNYVDAQVAANGNGDVLIGGNTAGAIMRLGTVDLFDLEFITNNATQMVITSGGMVGIGTPTPTAGFHVYGPGLFADVSGLVDGSPCAAPEEGAILSSSVAGKPLMQCDGSQWKVIAGGVDNIPNAHAPGTFNIDVNANDFPSIYISGGDCQSFVASYDFWNIQDGQEFKAEIHTDNAGPCSFNFYSDAGTSSLTMVGELPPHDNNEDRLYRFKRVAGNVYVDAGGVFSSLAGLPAVHSPGTTVVDVNINKFPDIYIGAGDCQSATANYDFWNIQDGEEFQAMIYTQNSGPACMMNFFTDAGATPLNFNGFIPPSRSMGYNYFRFKRINTEIFVDSSTAPGDMDVPIHWAYGDTSYIDTSINKFIEIDYTGSGGQQCDNWIYNLDKIADGDEFRVRIIADAAGPCMFNVYDEVSGGLGLQGYMPPLNAGGTMEYHFKRNGPDVFVMPEDGFHHALLEQMSPGIPDIDMFVSRNVQIDYAANGQVCNNYTYNVQNMSDGSELSISMIPDGDGPCAFNFSSLWSNFDLALVGTLPDHRRGEEIVYHFRRNGGNVDFEFERKNYLMAPSVFVPAAAYDFSIEGYDKKLITLDVDCGAFNIDNVIDGQEFSILVTNPGPGGTCDFNFSDTSGAIGREYQSAAANGGTAGSGQKFMYNIKILKISGANTAFIQPVPFF